MRRSMFSNRLGSSSTVRCELVEQPSTTCRRARRQAAPSVAAMSTIVDGSTAPAGLAGTGVRTGLPRPLDRPLGARGRGVLGGDRQARSPARTSIFSIFAEHIGFSIWVLWTIVVLNLGNVGITLSVSELFWLTAVPNLIGSFAADPLHVRGAALRRPGVDDDQRRRCC